MRAAFVCGVAAWIAACSSSVGPDVAAIDAARDVAFPAPGTAGAPCAGNSSCASHRCLPTGICTAACSADSNCPPQWACSRTDGGAGECVCNATPEVCDGLDNDCNGLIDDNVASCACAISTESRCGASCTDTTSDRANCGSCGHTCARGDTCRNGVCDNAALDLLYVIYNDITRDQQSDLMAHTSELIQTLTNPPCVSATNPTPHVCDPSSASDATIFAAVRSLNVGVVSTDLGTPGSSVPGCSNSELGDDGRLNPIRYGDAISHHEPWQIAPPTFGRPTDCTDPNEFPAFITFDSTSDDPTRFAHDVNCNVGLYANGCGLASPLEAAYRALITHDARDTPGNTSPNAGFVRSDAVLAIVMLSFTDDRSVRNCPFANGTACDGMGGLDVYNPASTAWASMEMGGRFSLDHPCTDDDPTWPIERYIDPTDPSAGLLSLKPGHPGRVVFGAIAGVPLSLPMTGSGNDAHIVWDDLLGTLPDGVTSDSAGSFCQRDSSGLGHLNSAEGPISMQQANQDTNCAQRVVPACRGEGSTYNPLACTSDVQYYAQPARRIVEVARRFDESPLCHHAPCRNGTVASICATSVWSQLAPFVRNVQRAL